MASLKNSANGLPIVQGIELVPTHQLPDRIRSCFPFPLFNAMQSKCFATAYKSNDNLVLSSPTGSGKTAILELAICRLVLQSQAHRYKIIYQAPTKSLCSERQKDWQTKFSHLGLECSELTGDTDQNQLRYVQNADVIITTPEKWDSVTRKWKDHRKLMELVKLFLIDEVHILKEDRGACLEAVVSRMKSIGSDVRFVALSATVPNSEDIAIWLGRNTWNRGEPAAREVFGEEFRPVRLQKHVLGFQSAGNDFQFEQVCNNHLTNVISKHSQGRPIMVFCFTRKSTEQTAELLARWWSDSKPQDQHWTCPSRQLRVSDEALRNCMDHGVAFHHAGIDQQDRLAIERAYLDGDINVICCTSTLAVGVNLPCHLVIVKNTITYQAEGCKEYSDLDIMQMLGRAGRPQFDTTAVAVIMTKIEKVRRYEKMVSGQELLESTLHLNLIDHLNAEIGLGTVKDAQSARVWLEGTFLYVRFRQNPEHYKIAGDTRNRNLDNRVEQICKTDLTLLHQYQLITDDNQFKSTEFGEAMARYCVQFNTMTLIMGLQPKAKISEILSAIAQASEFKNIRFRSGEKNMFKEVNRSSSIKFPIRVDLALPAHKVSLIIQSVLGGLDMRNENRFAGQRQQYFIDENIIFQHVHRLVRCIIDCQLYQEDSVAARNALELARSLGAKAWDDSPLQMIQIEKVGPVAVRKLVSAGIKTIEELDNTESQKIDMILSKNPPFGAMLLANLKTFPKLRVSLKLMGQPSVKSTKDSKFLQVRVKAELGFLNDTAPSFFMKKAVHVCLLAETSDGHKVHFCRISGNKLGNGQAVLFTANLTNAQQVINCYVSCDDIAGTLKYATLNPGIPASTFPTIPVESPRPAFQGHASKWTAMNERATTTSENEEFDIDIDDADLNEAVATLEPDDMDEFADIDSIPDFPAPKTQKHLAGAGKPRKSIEASQEPETVSWQPRKLKNGKWACNHKCKDKMTCKHMCCREGTDNKPKPPKGDASENVPATQITQMKGFSKQSKPASDLRNLSFSKRTEAETSLPVPSNHGFQLSTLSNSLKNKDGQSSMTICSQNEGSSPGLYNHVSDLFDDYAGIPERSSSYPNFQKGRSLFLNDGSSSDPPSIPQIDLSGSNFKRPYGLGEKNPNLLTQVPAKKQRLGDIQPVTNSSQFLTLQDLETSAQFMTFRRSEDFASDDFSFEDDLLGAEVVEHDPFTSIQDNRLGNGLVTTPSSHYSALNREDNDLEGNDPAIQMIHYEAAGTREEDTSVEYVDQSIVEDPNHTAVVLATLYKSMSEDVLPKDVEDDCDIAATAGYKKMIELFGDCVDFV